MNEQTTEAMVRSGLLAGFGGVDTANHYRNHRGVRRGIAAARAAGHSAPVWLQTKIVRRERVKPKTRPFRAAAARSHTRPPRVRCRAQEGCGNSVDPRSPVRLGSCYHDTLAVFEASLRELGVASVDLTLLHSPPCVPGAPWVQECIGHPMADLVYPLRCDCDAAQPCRMMQQQWSALEAAFAANKTRAIGVSVKLSPTSLRRSLAVAPSRLCAACVPLP